MAAGEATWPRLVGSAQVTNVALLAPCDFADSHSTHHPRTTRLGGCEGRAKALVLITALPMPSGVDLASNTLVSKASSTHKVLLNSKKSENSSQAMPPGQLCCTKASHKVY